MRAWRVHTGTLSRPMGRGQGSRVAARWQQRQLCCLHLLASRLGELDLHTPPLPTARPHAGPDDDSPRFSRSLAPHPGAPSQHALFLALGERLRGERRGRGARPWYPQLCPASVTINLRIKIRVCSAERAAGPRSCGARFGDRGALATELSGGGPRAGQNSSGLGPRPKHSWPQVLWGPRWVVRSTRLARRRTADRAVWARCDWAGPLPDRSVYSVPHLHNLPPLGGPTRPSPSHATERAPRLVPIQSSTREDPTVRCWAKATARGAERKGRTVTVCQVPDAPRGG